MNKCIYQFYSTIFLIKRKVEINQKEVMKNGGVELRRLNIFF